MRSIQVIQVRKTQIHTIGLNRLWRVGRPDKVDGRQTEHAKGTPSCGGRSGGKQEKRRVHFITFISHPPSPSHPPWVESMRREIYSAQPLWGEQGGAENTCACLLDESAFALVSVNLKTIEMNKGRNPVGVRWVCALIQEAKCGSFVMSWPMRLWTSRLDSCCHPYRHRCSLLDLFFFHDG